MQSPTSDNDVNSRDNDVNSRDNDVNSRDSLLLFDEASHRYLYTPTGEYFTSGTTFVHHFFEPFDGPKVVAKMMASSKWPSSPYYGRTKESILEGWKRSGEEAAASGTAMHAHIEDELSGRDTDWSLQPREAELFHRVREELNTEQWRPYRLEWRIFTEDYKVAGTLDALFINPQGEYLLVDWKRSKEIFSHNPFQRGKGPLSDLSDCNQIHYTLQLNLYAWILKRHYGINVSHMRLYCLHPKQSDPLCVDVPFWPSRIETMLKSHNSSA